MKMKKLAGTFKMPEGRVPSSEEPDWSVNQYSWGVASQEQKQIWIDEERKKIDEGLDKLKSML